MVCSIKFGLGALIRPSPTERCKEHPMNKPIPELTLRQLRNFWSKVDVRGPDECWNWTANKLRKGYGTFGLGSGKIFKAHRISMAIDGRDPLELCGLHACDNPPCCNPAHLFAGTNAENIADREAKHRRTAIKGEAVTNSKLKKSDILAIRTDARQHREIAADYGVAHSTIGRIKRRTAWAHIT